MKVSVVVSMSYSHLKRFLDFSFAIVCLFVLAPILIILAILVGLKIGSPIIFSQLRPGLHGNIFRLYKFRTMLELTDQSGNPLPDQQRLNKFGLILRSTSLDELPALVNVLKGEMSLVGPRPLLVEYLPLYSDAQLKRHNVRPGITGLAQINGRNSLSWPMKFAYDLEYVESYNLFLDLKIIAVTGLRVLQRSGISDNGDVGMEKFRGEQ